MISTILIFLTQGQKPFTLEHGKTIPLHTCAASHQVGKVTLCDYLGADWTYDGIIDEPDRLFNAWVFNRAGSQSNKSLVSILYNTYCWLCGCQSFNKE